MGVYNPGTKKQNMKFLALAVVCVVLAASLVGVLAVYLPAQTQITDKDSTISSLNQQIADLQLQLSQTPNSTVYATQIANLNGQIATLNDELTSLNDQTSNYYNIAIMNASAILFSDQPITQDANSTTQVFSDQTFYSGYVSIQATASANTTYVEVLYSYAGSNFDYNQTVGTSGTAVFPVLPGTLTINIGNINQATANTATASATYYF